MKTKALRFMAIIGIVASVLFFVATAGHAATYGDFTYTVSNGEVTITDFPTSVSGSVTVPSEINGYPVTSIGDAAFYDCSSLTSITIPDSVNSIGYSTFYGCSSLSQIMIPDGVTSIGIYTFAYCSSLTSITIPNSVTSIGSSAFSDCSSLTSIKIPDSVTSIGSIAFGGCSSLNSITIPNSVTSIGGYAFSDCSNLAKITIPNSVTSMGDCAFYGCNSLEAVTLPFVGESRTAKSSSNALLGYVFGGSSSNGDMYRVNQVYNSSGNSSISYIPQSLKNVNITDATQIPYGAFYGCTSLENISINDGVSVISDKAFINCDNLTKLYIWDKDVVLPRNDIFVNGYFVTMYVYKGSTAEEYAIKYDIPFEYIVEEGALIGMTAKCFLSGSDIILHLKFAEEIENKVIIGAFYGVDGRLVKVVTLPVEDAVDAIYFTTPDSKVIEKAKVMTRESLTSTEPETVAATVEIIR